MDYRYSLAALSAEELLDAPEYARFRGARRGSGLLSCGAARRPAFLRGPYIRALTPAALLRALALRAGSLGSSALGPGLPGA